MESFYNFRIQKRQLQARKIMDWTTDVTSQSDETETKQTRTCKT